MRAAVTEAAARDLRVRMVGGGFAVGPVAMCDGILLKPDALTRMEWLDPEVILVAAGVTLAALVTELQAAGRGLDGLAGPAAATLAGAVSTAGYGPRAPLSNSVQALHLVGADGASQRVASDQPLARAAMGGLGAFGLITAVELRTLPTCSDEVTTTVATFDDALDSWREWDTTAHWLRMLWVPGSRRVAIHRGVRTPAGQGALSTAQPTIAEPRWRRRLGLAVPLVLPRLNRDAVVGSPNGSQTHVAWSAGVAHGTTREITTTWSVPLDCTLPALRTLREALRSAAASTTTAISVRTIDADAGLLSPFVDRRSALISARVRLPAPFERYFASVAGALVPFSARPHWGSYLPDTGDAPMAGHPGVTPARALRAQIDPQGLFDSMAVARLLGS